MNNETSKEMFDIAPDRKNTGSLKWDLHPEASPYWVADMDFRSPDCVVEALQERVDHGVFGYALPPSGFCGLLARYMKESHGVGVATDWIVHIGGCVPALATAVSSYCKAGDSIMTCSPVYPPIRSVHSLVGAALIEVPHIFEGGRWTFDWEAMEKSIRPDTKMFILCNPQNPLGRVFGRDELVKLAEFCERHGLILCSDEIHCDLVLDEGVSHVSALSLPEQYLSKMLVMTAPSKTYNIAGIGYSMVLIPDADLRARFEQVLHLGQPPVNCLAYAAAQAAYGEGEPWRKALVSYLRENRDQLYRFCQERMPKIKLYPMQATYLAWMDCTALGLEDPQAFFMEKAGVFVNPGVPFGLAGHVRFNFGTQREGMLAGLEKMANAIDSLGL